MSNHIDSWAGGYLAVRDEAIASRGAVELDSGARWPCTTGDDVVTIAALFDQSVRDAGTPGLQRRWRGALDEIKHEALPAPDDAYAENRSFWSTLELAAITLDEHGYPMPSETSWRRLLREVGAPAECAPRNASAAVPFGPFDAAHTLDEIYRAEYQAAQQQRGADTLAPPAGFGGVTKPIPRTTNADVLALAAYWTMQLANTREVMGTDSARTRWQAAIADVDALAKRGTPDDVYAKNNEFWRTLGTLSDQLGAAAEAPTTLDLLKQTAADLPAVYKHAAESVGGALVDAGEAIEKSAVGALKKPLLSIGGGLLGLYLLRRRA